MSWILHLFTPWYHLMRLRKNKQTQQKNAAGDTADFRVHGGSAAVNRGVDFVQYRDCTNDGKPSGWKIMGKAKKLKRLRKKEEFWRRLFRRIYP